MLRRSLVRMAALMVVLLVAAGCVRDRCYKYYSCNRHSQCRTPQLPPGLCLDDRETGFVCAYYFDVCPTKLEWDECGGNGDRKSSWAGRCVRPEYIPDLGTDGSPPPPDLAVEVDAPGPS
jgi:hypothetical protein